MNSGRITDNNWQKQNSRLIGEIQARINHLNQERFKGLITDAECLELKPKCVFQDKVCSIVGYSYCCGNHKYLNLKLKAPDQTQYFSIYAYHLDPNLITIEGV